MLDSAHTGILRSMAWERAKGELNSMLYTFLVADAGNNYEKFSDKLKGFIEEVENQGLQE